MITKKKWDNLSEQIQDELSEQPFSYRQCEKCLNYIDLGGINEENAEGMYLDGVFDDYSEESIEQLESKYNFSLINNCFCWKCITDINKKLQKTHEKKTQKNILQTI